MAECFQREIACSGPVWVAKETCLRKNNAWYAGGRERMLPWLMFVRATGDDEERAEVQRTRAQNR